MTELIWKPATGRYESGERLMLGRVPVGSASYSGIHSKGDPLHYAASCLLPGMKRITDRFATIEEAKARVETVVRTWIQVAGLGEK